MTTYTAEIPNSILWDRGAIDDLLGMGAITITFTYETSSRASAIQELSHEFDWRNMDREFWDKRLSGKRGTR